ncbi:MAG: alpha/beta fold hydrolase [Candidatus Omnitrophota bacterium]|nr:alpha/beta fold hydrolase [Candidatus Omnitrophota bacterium]
MVESTRTHHTLTSADGVLVSVEHYHAPGREAAVIICPGFFQSKETGTFQRLSLALAAHWDVLAMDFRGHGRSTGLYTFSASEGADLEALLRWATARYPRLGVLAFSLGAAIAVNTLSRQPEGVRSLIAVSGPSSFEEIEFQFWTPEAMRTGLQGCEPGSGCRPGNPLMKKERPVETVRAIRAIPKFFIHGTHDVIVGHPHSQRLYAAAPEPKRLELIEGGSHAEALFRDDPKGFLHLVEPWLTETLTAPRRSLR